MAEGKKNWIAGAVKHPGALREKLHVKAGEKIPATKLAEDLGEEIGVAGPQLYPVFKQFLINS